MSKCDWFRCENDGAIPVAFLSAAPLSVMGGVAHEIESVPARLCLDHADELRDTFALFRLGNERRAANAPLFAQEQTVAETVTPVLICTECGHVVETFEAQDAFYVKQHYITPDEDRPLVRVPCVASGRSAPQYTVTG